MVFFILFPSRAVQLKFNKVQVLWICSVVKTMKSSILFKAMIFRYRKIILKGSLTQDF
jgi:hypothetical protein